MSVYPNGRFMSVVRGRHFGPAPGLNVELRGLGDRLNRFLALPKTQSTPDGYGMRAVVPPYTAGGMSAQVLIETTIGTAELIKGGPVEGSFSSSLTGTSGLSLVVGLAGNAAVVSLTGSNLILKLTIGLSGEGSWSLTGIPNLAMIVPFEGAGSVFSVTGLADLKGRLSMSGEWTPFSELSPEGLAAAVWDSLLAQHQGDGTAGKALSTAGSGGVDLEALASAVWTHLSRTLTEGAVPSVIDITSALESAVLPVNVTQMNSTEVIGTGVTADKWRGVGEPE